MADLSFPALAAHQFRQAFPVSPLVIYAKSVFQRDSVLLVAFLSSHAMAQVSYLLQPQQKRYSLTAWPNNPVKRTAETPLLGGLHRFSAASAYLHR